MPDLSTDENLLFGVIAMQSDLIDMQQFVDACTLWSTRKESSLAEILIQQQWLTKEDCEHVNYLLRRRMEKHGQSARQSLAAAPMAVTAALSSISDDAIRQSLQGAASEASFPRTLAPAEPLPQGKVTLRGLHSTGGIGQVWLAFDEVLQREIALKELKADQARSPRSRERFFREAQLTGQLEHPGIVPVYEYAASEDGERRYYTMRFVRGRTLTEEIRDYHERRASRPGVEATTELIRMLNIFTSICHTIAYAHSRDVIHRDLKGDNVILGDFGEVIVLDWGLAKRLGEESPTHGPSASAETVDVLDTIDEPTPAAGVTMQGEKLGTPAYMAPEQATGNHDLIDKRTDVYGLAAILYEILVGEPPFLGSSVVHILHSVIHEPPVHPTRRDAEIPVELEQICLQGLAKDRDDRQPSVAELAEQVQGWIARRAERKRTEQERERFFNLSLDLLAILDADGVLVQTNPAWTTLLGWQPWELTTMTAWDVVHREEHAQLKYSFRRILAGVSLTEIELRCLCKDGTHRWVVFNARLIAGEDKIYLVGRDITERKRSESTFQELLESAPDAMVVVEASGRIVLVNAQLQRLFGFSRQELMGQPIEVLVPEEFRENHPAHVAKFVASPDFRPMASGLQLFGRRKDGSVFPAEVSLSPVRTEQGLLVSCAVRTRPGS